MGDLLSSLPLNSIITKLLWIIRSFEVYLLKILNAITGQELTWDDWIEKFSTTAVDSTDI